MRVGGRVGRVAANPQQMKNLAQEESSSPLWTTFHCCCSIRLAGSMCMFSGVNADGALAGSRVPILMVSAFHLFKQFGRFYPRLGAMPGVWHMPQV